MNSTERLPSLDGLRAISILLVLGAHMLPLGPKSLALNHAAGAMGMSLFFVLSGFLITSTLIHNADVCEFMVRRLARIIPLAYAYAILVFVFLSFDPGALFFTSAFLVNYVLEFLKDGNAHFWSLCVEIHFYLAIAIVVLAAGKRGVWVVWPACLAVTLLRAQAGAYINIHTHLRVDEILAGACVATLYRNGWNKLARFRIVIVGLAALSWFVCSSPHTGWLQYLRPYATGLLLAAVLCASTTRLGEVLGSRPMRYIAAISYALYVLHPLTIQGWWNQGGVVERYLFKRPISFVMTFLLAHLSTYHWEHLWIRAGRTWIERRRMRRMRPGTLASSTQSGSL